MRAYVLSLGWFALAMAYLIVRDRFATADWIAFYGCLACSQVWSAAIWLKREKA